MKILHTVEFYLPFIGGMQEVGRQLSERFARKGHDVTVATTYCPERTSAVMNGVKVEQFKVSGNLVKGMAGEVESYRRFLLDSDFDVITNFGVQQWATDAMIEMLDRVRGKKVLVPTGFSGLYMSQYKDYFRSMKGWMKQYDMHIFLSENYRDINFARENRITNFVVIPNGADEDEMLFCKAIDIRGQLRIPETHFLVLHVGAHTWHKGHKEAMEIFKLAKIDNATFLLVANPRGGCSDSCQKMAAELNASAAFRSCGKRIIVTSLPRGETVAAFQEADLFLFPSNIECSPVVLYEALASKTPFLTTDVGNAAEIVGWTNGGVVLPTVRMSFEGGLLKNFLLVGSSLYAKCGGNWRPANDIGLVKAKVSSAAKLLEALHGDRDRCRRLAEAGFSAWQNHFTWGNIAGQYENLYTKLCASP
jgi:glycosyltransferase involved in cell wall biosynthesis